MRYLPRLAVLVIICTNWQAGRSRGALLLPLFRCRRLSCQGTVSFMFWGDKGEYAEQSAVVAAKPKQPVWSASQVGLGSGKLRQ